MERSTIDLFIKSFKENAPRNKKCNLILELHLTNGESYKTKSIARSPSPDSAYFGLAKCEHDLLCVDYRDIHHAVAIVDKSHSEGFSVHTLKPKA